MWLLDTLKLGLVEFMDQRQVAGKYAILSHTWEDEEVTFDDMKILDQATRLKGYWKIWYTCAQAIKDGHKYAWIDTCCINKNSSAELSEAINSMYRWYYDAAICYTYLKDFQLDTHGKFGGSGDSFELEHIQHCRWFTRGWTLQELIAPIDVKFYDSNWIQLFSRSDPGVVRSLSKIARVDPIVLMQRDTLEKTSIASRLSWAALRTTTRIEDQSYCLLGVLGLNMPLLYGEGERAFSRLQEELIKTSTDLSILAWAPMKVNHQNLLLAPDLKCFGYLSDRREPIETVVADYTDPLEDAASELTNKALRANLPMRQAANDDEFYVALNCSCRGDRIGRHGTPLNGRFSLKLRKVRRKSSGHDFFGREVYEVCRDYDSTLPQEKSLWFDHKDAWLDDVWFAEVNILRVGVLVTVYFDQHPEVEIVEAFPSHCWHWRDQEFRLLPNRRSHLQVGTEGYVRLRHRKSGQSKTLGFHCSLRVEPLSKMAVAFLPESEDDSTDFSLQFPVIPAEHRGRVREGRRGNAQGTNLG